MKYVVVIKTQGEDADALLMEESELSILKGMVLELDNVTVASFLEEDVTYTAEEAYNTFIEWGV